MENFLCLDPYDLYRHDRLQGVGTYCLYSIVKGKDIGGVDFLESSSSLFLRNSV